MDTTSVRVPAGEYMNPAQLQFFKTLLEQRRSDVLSALNDTSLELEAPINCPDPTDRATMEEERTLQLLDRDRQLAELKEIDLALQRIESNEYGWCHDTGEEIGIERLCVLPTAIYTVDALVRREQHARLYAPVH